MMRRRLQVHIGKPPCSLVRWKVPLVHRTPGLWRAVLASSPVAFVQMSTSSSFHVCHAPSR